MFVIGVWLRLHILACCVLSHSIGACWQHTCVWIFDSLSLPSDQVIKKGLDWVTRIVSHNFWPSLAPWISNYGSLPILGGFEPLLYDSRLSWVHHVPSGPMPIYQILCWLCLGHNTIWSSMVSAWYSVSTPAWILPKLYRWVITFPMYMTGLCRAPTALFRQLSISKTRQAIDGLST